MNYIKIQPNLFFHNKPTSVKINIGNKTQENATAKEIKDIYKNKLNSLLTIEEGTINPHEFNFKTPSKQKKGIESLKNIVLNPKDENPSHKPLKGIKIEENNYIATDATKLIILKRPKNDNLKTNKTYLINETYKNYMKDFYKINHLIEENPLTETQWEEKNRYIEEFPNYKAIIPTQTTYTSPTIQILPLLEYSYKATHILKKSTKNITSNFYFGKHKITIDLSKLYEILLCFKTNDIQFIKFEFNEKQNCILIKSQCKTATALLMKTIAQPTTNPIYIGENPDELTEQTTEI